METTSEITDVQWEAAREAFMQSLSENQGMPERKYDRILDVLSAWDEMSPAERREMAGGNQAYWYGKYAVSDLDGDKHLLIRETVPGTNVAELKRCSHVNRMFEDIRQVHTESELLYSNVLPPLLSSFL
jgi:hypothetical protein